MFISDRFILGLDRALRTISCQAQQRRPNPAQDLAEAELSVAQQAHSAALMRINHVGEICAQALYDAQAMFSQDPAVKQRLQRSGLEEEDHLAWTAHRLRELNSRPSLLNPLWYAGAYAIGSLAAKAGDAVSLGFVVETEKQVEAHLASHLQALPEHDEKSRAIVEQMRLDEIEHGEAAQNLGAKNLPAPVKLAMKAAAKCMTSTAYYL